MTIRKEYPGRRSTATSHFGAKCPEARGACQCKNTPQEWGRKLFRAERKRRSALEAVVYQADDKQLASCKTLIGRKKAAKANPKIAVLQVELAHVDSEIEKPVDSLTGATPPVRYRPCAVPYKLYFSFRKKYTLQIVKCCLNVIYYKRKKYFKAFCSFF